MSALIGIIAGAAVLALMAIMALAMVGGFIAILKEWK